MTNSSIGEWLGCVFGAVLTVVQTEALFQVISLICTIVCTLVTIAFNIWKWYIKAKEDGKIDVKEIEELEEQIKKEIKK